MLKDIDKHHDTCYCDLDLARERYYMLKYVDEEMAQTHRATWETVTGRHLFPSSFDEMEREARSLERSRQGNQQKDAQRP